MPLARKSRLLELTRRHGQFVIEDDYESEVSFNKTLPRALKSLDRWGNVIYVGSLSKSLLHGQRLMTGIYSQRCDVMHESLERHFPGAAAKPKYGGAIVWLKLPEEVDAGVLHGLVEPDGVFFETGGFTFSDEQSNRNHIRLGYSVIDAALIAEGIDRIARAVPEARRADPVPGNARHHASRAWTVQRPVALPGGARSESDGRPRHPPQPEKLAAASTGPSTRPRPGVKAQRAHREGLARCSGYLYVSRSQLASVAVVSRPTMICPPSRGKTEAQWFGQRSPRREDDPNEAQGSATGC